MTTRVSKEPERPRRFHRQSGWGDRNRQLPGPRWDAHDRGEQTTGDTMVSAREEIERVEMDGGESERPIRNSHGISSRSRSLILARERLYSSIWEGSCRTRSSWPS